MYTDRHTQIYKHTPTSTPAPPPQKKKPHKQPHFPHIQVYKPTHNIERKKKQVRNDPWTLFVATYTYICSRDRSGRGWSVLTAQHSRHARWHQRQRQRWWGRRCGRWRGRSGYCGGSAAPVIGTQLQRVALGLGGRGRRVGLGCKRVAFLRWQSCHLECCIGGWQRGLRGGGGGWCGCGGGEGGAAGGGCTAAATVVEC